MALLVAGAPGMVAGMADDRPILREPPPMPGASPAFALVCHCCRWPRSDDSIAAIREAAVGVDMERVVRIALRHRVAGLVHDGLQAAGIAPPQRLAARARDTALRGVHLAAELRRITALFDSAGVTFAVLKGAPLAMLAYGSLGLKSAIDIDLAVLPDDRARAAALLREAGYVERPSGSDKHSRWASPTARITVELHHALVDIRPWLAGLTAADATRRVKLAPDIKVPVFEHDDLVAYLCVHGASHGWSRLKWLADLAALLAPLDPASVERTYRHAGTIGAARCVAQGLLLASDYLGLRLDPRLERELRGDPTLRRLVGLARRTFTGRNETAEFDGRAFATLPIHAAHLSLGMRRRDAIPALADKIAAPGRLIARLRRR